MRFYFGPKDLLGILQRRFFWALIPFLILCTIALAVIDQISPMYRSQARLLVQDQQIKSSWVESAVTSGAKERIDTVAARLEARDSLILLANDLDLFEGEGLTPSEKASRLQRNISISSRTTGQRNSGALLVTVRYASESPDEAQRVANELLSEFIRQSVDLRKEQAAGSTAFLRDEEEKITRSLNRIVGEINRIKQENRRHLPENEGLYERQLDRALSSISRINASLNQVEVEMGILEMQKPLMLQSGVSRDPLEAQLVTKRSQLAALRRQFSDNYPDVIALTEEVMDLERQIDPNAFRQTARRQIAHLEEELEILPENAAEREQIERRLADLREDLRNTPEAVDRVSLSTIEYEARKRTLEARQESLMAEREAAEAEVADVSERIELIPAVEAQLYRLNQEQAQLERDLARMRNVRSEAERGQALEDSAKAESLAVIEQPSRPDDPYKPDKGRLAVMAAAGSAGVAGLIALFPEIFFARVRSRQHLKDLLPGVKVIEVPRFEQSEPTLSRHWPTALLVLVSVGLGGIWSFTAVQTLT